MKQPAQISSEGGGPGPLSGVRVIDMTSVVMGPLTTQILADYGADVIKIETEEGDLLRVAGAQRGPKMGALFLQINRNKRSVSLNLKSDAGREALLALCESADVFVSNIRPVALSRLGLGYAAVKARKPDIIYASLVGYGQKGPYKDRPAYDDLIQGISALPHVMGQAQGTAPRYVPLTLTDKIAGISAAHAILAALVARMRTGLGQSVEVPMFEVMSQFVLSDHMGGHSFEPPIGPPGYNRLLSRDRRPYETADGFVSVLLYTDAHWRRFFDILGRADEFNTTPMFNDLATRAQCYDEVYRFVAGVIKTKSTAEWQQALESHDIPWSPAHSLEDLIADQHLRAVGMYETVEHPSEGTLRLLASPIVFGNASTKIYRPPPRLGEHTDEVLREIGLIPAKESS